MPSRNASFVVSSFHAEFGLVPTATNAKIRRYARVLHTDKLMRLPLGGVTTITIEVAATASHLNQVFEEQMKIGTTIAQRYSIHTQLQCECRQGRNHDLVCIEGLA